AAGRAADLDVAGLDSAEHLGEVPSGLLAASLGASPGELDVDVVGVRGNAVVSTPAGMRVAGAPDLAIPDHTLDGELLGERNESISQGGAVACAVGADAEVGRATLTVEGSGATAANRPAIVDAGVHATLGLVNGQKVVHCAPRARLGAGGTGTGALVCAGKDGHYSISSATSSSAESGSSSAESSSTGSAPSTGSKSSSVCSLSGWSSVSVSSSKSSSIASFGS